MIESRSPAAATPLMCAALPAWYASTPAMSAMTASPGRCAPRRGDANRSIAARKAWAVTGAPDGGAKRSPGRTRNVQVRPSAESDGSERAASGARTVPAAPAASG